MSNLLYKLIKLVFDAQSKFYKAKYQNHSNMAFTTSTTKTAMNGACTLKLNSKTEENKRKVDLGAKELIKRNIKTPEKLLEFVQTKGTKVYKTAKADTILRIIGEEEGFITPQEGIKALYLNFLIGILVENKLNISLKTKEMFLLRDLPVDIYIMSHQFHKWYGFKMKLPGYDFETQKKFKKLYKTLDDTEIKQCSLGEVISLKEAVARNVESIDFVVSLAREYEGSKKSLEKIKTKAGASV